MRGNRIGILFTLMPRRRKGNCRSQQQREIRAPALAATIIDGMKPQTVGRVLGVGLRVAGRLAGQRLAAAAGDPGSAATRPVTVAGVGGPGTQRAPSASTAAVRA